MSTIEEQYLATYKQGFRDGVLTANEAIDNDMFIAGQLKVLTDLLNMFGQTAYSQDSKLFVEALKAMKQMIEAKQPKEMDID